MSEYEIEEIFTDHWKRFDEKDIEVEILQLDKRKDI
jgi:hypothetical protein